MNLNDARPIAYDICCGLGGWTEALLDEGYRVIGFDVEAHDYGTGGYPGELRLRDITTIHGSELKDAALIVCSPPCQRYSYMAMPWSRAKAQAAMIEADTTGDELRKLNLLFETCFRLQREASEAAGHHIPMIVENVRGAQKWVGRAAYHYGSFYLWGDVPALMPIVQSRKMKTTGPVDAAQSENHNCHINEMRDSLKVPGFRFDGSGKSFQTASVDHIKTPGRSLSKGSPNKFGTHNMGAGDKMMAELGVKADGSGWTEKGSLLSHNRLVSNQRPEGIKVPGISLSAGKSVGFNVTAAQRYREDAARKVDEAGLKGGGDWFGSGEDCSLQRRFSGSEGMKRVTIGGTYAERKAKGDPLITTASGSNSRKAASAMIAKIPYPLALHIARTFKPR